MCCVKIWEVYVCKMFTNTQKLMRVIFNTSHSQLFKLQKRPKLAISKLILGPPQTLYKILCLYCTCTKKTGIFKFPFIAVTFFCAPLGTWTHKGYVIIMTWIISSWLYLFSNNFLFFTKHTKKGPQQKQLHSTHFDPVHKGQNY